MSNKYNYAFFAIIALLIVFGIAFLFVGLEVKNELQKQNETKQEDLGGLFNLQPTYLNQNSATTSRTAIYPPTGLNETLATTSIPFSLQNTELYDIDILVLSTTTPWAVPRIIWTYEFSNTCTGRDVGWNNCEWFSESGQTVNSNISVTHGTPTVHDWTVATSGISKINLQTPSTAAKYGRINIGTNATTTIWLEAVPKVITK